MEVLALTIDEVVKAGGPCRAKIYQEIRAGRLRAVKIGRSTRILLSDLMAYFAALPAIEPKHLTAKIEVLPESGDFKLKPGATPQLYEVGSKIKRVRRRRPRRSELQGPVL